MTERGSASLQQEPATLGIGPSSVSWDGNEFRFQIEEVTVPLPSRIRGEVRVRPHALVRHTSLLDAAGIHRWCPIAPTARVEVSLSKPGLRWSGEGYVDSNHGDQPMETALRSWNWSRGRTRAGCAVLYDVQPRDGDPIALALHFDRNGEARAFPSPPSSKLPTTAWRVARASRSEDGRATLERGLEDTPFYARSLVQARLLGESITSVHECLDLDRFRSPIVQAMLPFRMPRTG